MYSNTSVYCYAMDITNYEIKKFCCAIALICLLVWPPVGGCVKQHRPGFPAIANCRGGRWSRSINEVLSIPFRALFMASHTARIAWLPIIIGAAHASTWFNSLGPECCAWCTVYNTTLGHNWIIHVLLQFEWCCAVIGAQRRCRHQREHRINLFSLSAAARRV